MADWEVVSEEARATPACPAAAFLEKHGLGKHAARILEVSDAESVDDLKLIDAMMAEQIIKDVELKGISEKKFAMALAALREENPSLAAAPTGSGPLACPSPSHNPGTSSSGAVNLELSPPVAAVQERIVVCLDRSGSMGSPFKEVTLNVVHGDTRSSVAERSRMEAVKVMFYAFRDRIDSMGTNTHELGLLQFDNAVETMLDLTKEMDKFEAIVDNVRSRGSTAIYSAIIQAAGMLAKDFTEESPVDLRILVLTDGQSNTGAPPAEALAAVNAIGATVDAILVGDRPDANLRRIVTATEGECYGISSLGEGFELLESESVVSLKARRGGTQRVFKRRELVDLEAVDERIVMSTSAMAQQVAQREADKHASKKVMSLQEQQQQVQRCVDGSGGSDASSVSQRRILAELSKISQGQALDPEFYTGIHVFPSSEDLTFWRVLMEGPKSSPFADGVFELAVQLPQEYPLRPPSINFVTPIYHCNVSDTGKICIDVLQSSWSPSLSVHKCLMMIRALLSEPCPDDSMRQWIAELTIAHQKSQGEDTRYYDKAKELVKQHASRSIAEWQQLWGAS